MNRRRSDPGAVRELPVNGKIKPIHVEIRNWIERLPDRPSYETVLTQTTRAMKLGIDVAERTGRMTPHAAVEARNRLAASQFPNADAVEQIHAVLLAGLNARKRGLLKLVTSNGRSKSR